MTKVFRRDVVEEVNVILWSIITMKVKFGDSDKKCLWAVVNASKEMIVTC